MRIPGLVCLLLALTGCPAGVGKGLGSDTNAPADTDTAPDRDTNATADTGADTATEADADADGADASVDCDEGDATVYPGAAEVCGDGRVNDCDESADQALSVCELAGEVSLESADGRILGGESEEATADVLASAGDVNGDGRGDVLLDSPYYDDGVSEIETSAVWLVNGPISGDLPVDDADARIFGSGTAGFWGLVALAGAGDTDDDGYDDLLLGASNDNEGGSDAGAAWIYQGPVSGDLAPADADAKLLGSEDHPFAGNAVAGLGDTDGDGYADLLVGAPSSVTLVGGISLQGAAWVVRGPVSGERDLSAADGQLFGAASGDLFGFDVASAGDTDGDGLADLLVGGPRLAGGKTGAGMAWLFLGPVSGTVAAADADARFAGRIEDDYATGAVVGPGDTDGDGLNDLFIGVHLAGLGDSGAYAACLTLGPALGHLDVAAADATVYGGSYSGGIAGAGDLNGDGRADLVLGAPADEDGGRDAGGAYPVFSPVSGSVDLADATVKIIGENKNDVAGSTVAGAGDTNADGLDDLLIGSPYAEGDAGEAWLVLGRGY